MSWPQGYEVEWKCEQIEITSNWRTLDPDAQWHDYDGHVHRNVPRTYVTVQEPDYIDADGEEWPGDTVHSCPICGETLYPPTKGPDGFRKFMQGPISATVTYPDGVELLLTSHLQLDDVSAARGLDQEIVRVLLERIRAEAMP